MSASDALTDLVAASERLREEREIARARRQPRRLEMLEEAIRELSTLGEHVRRLADTSNATPMYAPAVDYLTPLEHEVLALTGKLATALNDVIGEGPSAESDKAEGARRVNFIQELVMAQAAARAYPDRYRVLGQRLDPTCGNTDSCNSTGVDGEVPNP